MQINIKNQRYVSKVKIFAFSFIFLTFTFSFLILGEVRAHCPLCVAGAGAGLTLSRLLGIDDSITGIWLGAFIGAISFWTQRLLGLKQPFFFRKSVGSVIYVLFLLLTIWSFYRFNLVVKHGDIFGFDKLTFGMVLGGTVFYLMDYVNAAVKRRNGKALFPYQAIVFSLSSILLTSLGVYVLINYYI